MHFKQLEVFVSVVKHKSFSKAAEAVYLSQPTVSAHISALEDELDAKLIIRSTKEVHLSKAGKIFYEYALEMLNLKEQAAAEVKSYATQVKGTLEIAASTVPALYLLPRTIHSLGAKYPELGFSLKECDSGEVVRHIIDMEAEVGVTGTIFEHEGCVFTPIARDRLSIITPNTPEYAALNGVITPDIIKNSRFIEREQGSGTRKESETFLREIGIEPSQLNIALRLDSTESIVQAVKNNLGISIVSKYACEDCLATGRILSFDYSSPALSRNFYAVHRKNRPLSPAAAAFIKEVRLIFDE